MMYCLWHCFSLPIPDLSIVLKIRRYEHTSFNTESMSPALSLIHKSNQIWFESLNFRCNIPWRRKRASNWCELYFQILVTRSYPFLLNLSILRSPVAKERMSFTIVGPQPWWETSISLHLKRTLLTRFPWWACPCGYLLYRKKNFETPSWKPK